jgi:hypothetical protein
VILGLFDDQSHHCQTFKSKVCRLCDEKDWTWLIEGANVLSDHVQVIFAAMTPTSKRSRAACPQTSKFLTPNMSTVDSRNFLRRRSTKLQRTVKPNSNSSMLVSRTRRTHSGHTSWILTRWDTPMTTLPRTTKIEINNTRPRCIDNSSQCFTTTTRCSLQSPSLLQLSFDSKPDRQFDCQGSPGGHDCRQ